MSRHKRGNVNDTPKADRPDEQNHVKGEVVSDSLKKVSIMSDSRHFKIHPKNVEGYFKMDKQIKQTFVEASSVPNNHLKNSYTGKIGELGTKQNVYAQRGNARVEIYDAKVGGKRDNGIDVPIKKGDEISVIESKATRTEATFRLSKTKTQGEQMSPEWIESKISEMWSSPKTAPTAELLSTQPFTKYILGADVNYGNQTVRIVTDPNRYKPLPEDVSIWNAANAASHTEMYAMRALNTFGKVTTYLAITMDATQIAGQIHHDIKKKDWSFSRTFRLVIEKGAGVVGSVAAVVALNAGTDFIGIGCSFIVGAEGYNVGQDLGSDFADTLGLSQLNDNEREEATRDGMNLIAGQMGTDFLDGIETAASTVSDGLSSGCELLNDNLSFEVCTPELKKLPASESSAPTETNNNTDISEPNASYPTDSNQLNSKPVIKLSDNPQTFYARITSIMRSREENSATPKEYSVSEKNHSTNNSFAESSVTSKEKPSGFHARRFDIMKSHAENKSTPENSQDAYPKCEVPSNSKNKSLLNESDNLSHYETPRPIR